MMNKIGTISSRLATLFEKLPIDVVYLYGSASRGENDQMSDYDFGVLFKKELSSKKRFDLRLELFSNIARTLNVNEDNIDVVDVIEMPVLLQFNIICGQLIYCNSEEARVLFEASVMARYHDEHYYLDRYVHETIAKIKKGVYFERKIPYA